MGTHRELILDASDVEEGLDLLPHLPPGPGAELQVLAQVALDNLESQPVGKDFIKMHSFKKSDKALSYGKVPYLCSCSFLYSLRDR